MFYWKYVHLTISTSFANKMTMLLARTLPVSKDLLLKRQLVHGLIRLGLFARSLLQLHLEGDMLDVQH